MDTADIRKAVDALVGEPNLSRRRLLALGWLSKALAVYGITPILVGGAAVEFYTGGGYATKDVDLALPSVPEVDAVFTALGFGKEGPLLVPR